MSSPAVRFAAAVLAVALGLWAGVKLYSVRNAAGEAGVPSPAGRSSGPAPGDIADVLGSPVRGVKIPDRLPAFALDDLAGRKTPISAFAGKSLIINFWATWCAPCRKEMPLLQALSSEWAERDVQVVGIAVDHRDPVVAYAQKLKIAYPLLIGDQDALDAAAALGVTTPVFPFTVFTDRQGEVVALFVGELHRDQAELILAKVAELNAKALALPAARKAISEGLRSLDAKEG